MSEVEPSGFDWRVLLLGGPSGVGKTSVSYTLARRFGAGICEVDDLHIVAKQVTTPVQQPVLHQWDTDPRAQDLSAERILELHIAVCRVMSPSIEAVVSNHVETNTPVVLEGDYVLPEVVRRTGNRVAAVFLYEPDEKQILRNFAQREPDGGEQTKRARVSWLVPVAERGVHTSRRNRDAAASVEHAARSRRRSDRLRNRWRSTATLLTTSTRGVA